MSKIAMAAAAHPDDIEFIMSGTLMLLGDAGYELHYMNIANGSCGSATKSKEEIIAIRLDEAREAAASIGAKWYPPLVYDIEIMYDHAIIRKLCAIVREVNPDILLLPSPQDYMEDHMNASRVMVTAAFCRNMRNYDTDPPTRLAEGELAVYHALPWALQDQLRNPIHPDFFVDITSMAERKRRMLSCHRSQKEWLDESQGMDNYLNIMDEMSARVGALSGKFAHAEGWRRHSHMGFGPEDFDPLGQALSSYITRPRDLPPAKQGDR
ncbi:MAG: PIG-L deacetylase family protein [Armatimonadota bacterium]|nr:PIG-L deacetylase family protein [Armatimonadota bacterium]